MKPPRLPTPAAADVASHAASVSAAAAAVADVVSLISALDAELSCVREEAAAERARAEGFSAIAAGHKMSADACMVRRRGSVFLPFSRQTRRPLYRRGPAPRLSACPQIQLEKVARADPNPETLRGTVVAAKVLRLAPRRPARAHSSSQLCGSETTEAECACALVLSSAAQEAALQQQLAAAVRERDVLRERLAEASGRRGAGGAGAGAFREPQEVAKAKRELAAAVVRPASAQELVLGWSSPMHASRIAPRSNSPS